MNTSHNYYFKPHLIDENPEWTAILHLGERKIVSPECNFSLHNTDLIFVRSGYVRFYYDAIMNKNNFVLIIGKNSLVNIGAVIAGINRVSRLTVEKEAEIVIFNAHAILNIEDIQANPSLYIGMVKTLAKTARLIALRAHNTCFHACLPRMCRIILDLTDANYKPEIQYPHRISQNDFAHLTGMHLVTASNVFKKLREHGILGKIFPTSIEVFDYQALKDISNSKRCL